MSVLIFSVYEYTCFCLGRAFVNYLVDQLSPPLRGVLLVVVSFFGRATGGVLLAVVSFLLMFRIMHPGPLSERARFQLFAVVSAFIATASAVGIIQN